ncbi:hypothetical protein ACIBCO_38960 [Streptomyces violascens]|uniref:hypothetical protein n=1 Tax=Streptomyces violascens TaxID=67381 RepID=UPI0037986B0C
MGTHARQVRHPRAYRVSHLNAGHLGQTFALTATTLGLGPFQSAAPIEAASGSTAPPTAPSAPSPPDTRPPPLPPTPPT